MTQTSSVIAAAVFAVAIGAWVQPAKMQGNRSQIAPGDWPNLNRDLAATRYSPLTEINTTNVTSLKRVWSFKLGGGATSVPLAVNGVMYLSSGPQVVALDGDTGQEIWSYAVPPVPAAPVPPSDQSPPPGGRRGGGPAVATASARGVGYWPGDEKLAPRILFMSGNRLMALDAANGKPAAGFGTDGSVTVGVPSRQRQRRRTLLHLLSAAQRSVQRAGTAGRSKPALPAPAMVQAHRGQCPNRPSRMGISAWRQRPVAGGKASRR